jgi:signal transduction histidine kinase/PAS domain-containing protein
MLQVESEHAPLRDPRLSAQLAECATGPMPAWLWSADGSRILWANAAGAAVFGAPDTGACTSRQFGGSEAAAGQIQRLAETLPAAGQARLERLRGFGAGFGRALTCACSRTAVADGTPAVLVIATEAAGPPLSLLERVRRLFPDRERALAVFTPDGTLLDATAPASRRLAGADRLSALGGAIAAQALAAGSASGETPYGPITLERLGREASTVLVLTFAPQPSAAPAVAIAPIEAAAPRAAAAGASVAPRQIPAPDEPPGERRHPLRFVWQMDADGRFVVGSDEFVDLIGPRTTAAFGRLWSEISAELKLDPDGQIARAVATHETWSGVTISWPVEEGGERLPVELSGLPVFDRDRSFRGYRGFGVCRDIARLNQLAQARRERPIGFIEAAVAPAAVEAVEELLPAEVPLPAAVASGAAEVAPQSEGPGTEATPAGANPAGANVVPFRPGAASDAKAPSLSPVERRAFRELAQELTARLRAGQEMPADTEGELAGEPAGAAEAVEAATPPAAERASVVDLDQGPLPAFEPVLLDRVPVGILVYGNDSLLYANRQLLDWSGHESLEALAAGGGLDALFAEPGTGTLTESGAAQSLTIMTRGGERFPVEGRLLAVPREGTSALALVLMSGEAEERHRATAAALAAAEHAFRELEGTLEPLIKLEDETRAAKREAEKAVAAKADFLAKVSHEIRTPLNAITGFAEVIMAERFGPIGNERYREYLKDIHAAGTLLVSLLNDLVDLSKIETGQLDLAFANVSLNELTQQCVGIMQPHASRARIIIRTSLTPGLPQVVADERSLRQIVLNLLSNSIRFTGPGGQVIVSTVFADNGEAVLRVRDTGVGMSEKDIAAAMEPFRQAATSGSWGSGGTGLGLPLTKALAEANRANFSIKSAPDAGTLVEVAFPPARVAQ